ncbi:Aureusidin synthase [Sesamum angolense]|uniref:Aureusidin synthase n=1 Tax=Sesamum angolense TaxID=2727404 RepID=A0AAE1W1Z3_9LAMI|nr:Aureusidin synthase [Sesamum angolense]
MEITDYMPSPTAITRVRRLAKTANGHDNMVKYETFALPFWNYDSPSGMEIPAMFNDSSSSFYDRLRNQDHLPPAVVDLNLDSFVTAGDGTPRRSGSGSVEIALHTTVHAWTSDSEQPFETPFSMLVMPTSTDCGTFGIVRTRRASDTFTKTSISHGSTQEEADEVLLIDEIQNNCSKPVKFDVYLNESDVQLCTPANSEFLGNFVEVPYDRHRTSTEKGSVRFAMSSVLEPWRSYTEPTGVSFCW